MRETNCVPDAVDPSPIIEEKLTVLADEHEPRSDALAQAIAVAGSDDVRGLNRTPPSEACVPFCSARGRESCEAPASLGSADRQLRHASP